MLITNRLTWSRSFGLECWSTAPRHMKLWNPQRSTGGCNTGSTGAGRGDRLCWAPAGSFVWTGLCGWRGGWRYKAQDCISFKILILNTPVNNSFYHQWMHQTCPDWKQLQQQQWQTCYIIATPQRLSQWPNFTLEASFICGRQQRGNLNIQYYPLRSR